MDLYLEAREAFWELLEQSKASVDTDGEVNCVNNLLTHWDQNLLPREEHIFRTAAPEEGIEKGTNG